jgi:hypothetical protein
MEKAADLTHPVLGHTAHDSILISMMMADKSRPHKNLDLAAAAPSAEAPNEPT